MNVETIRQGLRRHSWRVTAAWAAIGIAGGCSWEADGGGGACGGTPGEMGRVVLEFDQDPSRDLSDSTGSAFAAGTTALVEVKSMTDEAVPAFRAESSDTGVFGVSAGTTENRLVLAFLDSGVAILKFVSPSNGALIDQVTLRVERPRAMRLTSAAAGYPAAFDGAGLVGEPDRIDLATGGTCGLHAYLTDGSETALFGVFTPTITGDSAVSFESTGMSSLSLVGAPVHASFEVTALSEGAETVTLGGPGGLLRTMRFDVSAAPALGTVGLVLWPGYTDEFELGSSTFVTAVGNAPDGAPVYGFGVTFTSSDPSVARIQSVEDTSPAIAGISFEALGTATITAALTSDPSVSDSVVLTVIPEQPDSE